VVPGTTISLLATHGRCKGVSITGVRWPLESDRLEPLAGRGVSNIASDPQIEIAVSEGVLTVFTYAAAQGRP
jgi:thiamine pyrophosphokinase